MATDADPAPGEHAAMRFDFNAVDYGAEEGATVYIYSGDRYVSEAAPRSGDTVSIGLPDGSINDDGSVDIRLITSDDYTPYDCNTTVSTDTAPLCVVTTDPDPEAEEHAYVDFDFSNERYASTEGNFVYIYGGDEYAAHDYPVDGSRIPIALTPNSFTGDGSVDVRVKTSNPWVWTDCVTATTTPSAPLCVVTTDTTPVDGEAATVTYDFSSPLYASSEFETTYLFSEKTYAAWSTASTGSSVVFRIPDGTIKADGSYSFRTRTADPSAWRDCELEQKDATPVCTATTDTTPAVDERVVVAFDFDDPRFEPTEGQVAYIYGGEQYAGYIYPGDGSEVTVALPADGIAADGSVDVRILLSDNWTWAECVADTTTPNQLCVVTASDDPQPGETVSVRYDFSDRFYASSDQGSAYIFSRDIYLTSTRPSTGSVVDVVLPEGSVNRDGSVAIRVRTSTPVAFTDCYSAPTRVVEPLPTTTTAAPAPTTTQRPTTTVPSSDDESTTTTSSGDENDEESTTTTAADDNTTYEIEDAGLGHGATCQATTNEDMLPRRAISAAQVAVATQAYTTSFSTDDGMFRILSGSWSVGDGFYTQLNTCGFDYTALLRTRALENYRFEASFAGIDGPNHGGIIVGQASEESRSGAVLIDLTDSGNEVRWGYYDDAGYYQNIDSLEIDGPSAGQWVRLQADVVDGVVTVKFNGRTIASFDHSSTAGHVGLVSSTAVVGFDDVTLTALPSGN